ncbi:MAG: phosphoadenosine phosphosulfate reductase family protein [Saprospiraceae bacterium]
MIHQLTLFDDTPKPFVPELVKPLLYHSNCEIHICFSGGKDSVAMALYLVFVLKVDINRIRLHHHLVDGKGKTLFDWECTESYCQAFADAFGIPIDWSWRKGGIRREIFRKNEGLQPVLYQRNGEKVVSLESNKGNSTRYKFPAINASLKTRWCSSVVKIQPFTRYIADYYSFKQNHNILVLTGERRRESRARSKYKDAEYHTTKSKKRNVIHWRPVIDFNEKMVWDLYAKHKIQPHPAYELGWSRCSCQLCIFSSPNTWASTYELSPQKIQEIARTEQVLGFTLHDKRNIMQIVAKGQSFLKTANTARWQKEILNKFTSPIFVDKWTLPQGAYGNESSGSL